MEPRIEQLNEKYLIGMNRRMSLADNTTGELWRMFMPRRNEILNRVTLDLISMQVYDNLSDVEQMNPLVVFEKWAALEVANYSEIPEGMQSYSLPGGLYAVFNYKGLPQHATPFFQYIFTTWLPASSYALDNRPHFEVLGAAYKNNHPDSEEEVWIPIREKK